MQNYPRSKEVENNMATVPHVREKLANDAAGSRTEDLLGGEEGSDRILFQKALLQEGYMKDELDIDDKQAS
jgi:hypothetical protein